MAGLPKEIYIVVAEKNGDERAFYSCPIAFESENFDIQSAKKFQKRIGNKYGRTAIYKAEKIKE